MTFLFFGFILLLSTPSEASAADSQTTVQLLIQTAPPTLMALASLVAAIKGLRQGKKNGVKADAVGLAAVEANAKADQLNQKADLIHEVSVDTRDMANGNLSAVRNELMALHKKYEDLQRTVAGAGSDTVMAELQRIATNVHRLANAITPLLGQEIQLMPRPIPKKTEGPQK